MMQYLEDGIVYDFGRTLLKIGTTLFVLGLILQTLLAQRTAGIIFLSFGGLSCLMGVYSLVMFRWSAFPIDIDLSQDEPHNRNVLTEFYANCSKRKYNSIRHIGRQFMRMQIQYPHLPETDNWRKHYILDVTALLQAIHHQGTTPEMLAHVDRIVSEQPLVAVFSYLYNTWENETYAPEWNAAPEETDEALRQTLEQQLETLEHYTARIQQLDTTLVSMARSERANDLTALAKNTFDKLTK